MKEHPILFSAPMVRAIIEGRKTQTRRVCKPAMESALSFVVGPMGGEVFGDEEGDVQFRCPYGKQGDRLWLRETFALIPMRNLFTGEPSTLIEYRAGKQWLPRGREPAVWEHYKPDEIPWKPSIHMPRWASRILLEITNIRIERLQDISQAEAQAEGWNPLAEDGKNPAPLDPYGWYRMLWSQINGAESWDSNPLVWVIEFKRVEMPA